MSERTHYEVLELPQDATVDQVKKRFRELARKYHPDLHQDHPEYHEIFVRITQAYEVLSDATRRAYYDLDLRQKSRRQSDQRAGTHGSAPFTQSHPPPPPPNAAGRAGAASARAADARSRREADQRRQEMSRLMESARQSYARGNLRDAQRLCEDVLQRGRFGPAYEMLGDIFSRQGHDEDALHNYTIAAQMMPTNGLIMSKLNRVVSRVSHSQEVDPFRPGSARRAIDPTRKIGYRLGVSCFGLAAVLFLLIWRPDVHEPAMGLPLVPHWTLSQFAFMGLAGLITGALLAVAGWVRPVDQELLYQSIRVFRRQIPMGLVLGFLGAIFFPMTLGVYVVLGLIQSSISRSTLGVFAIVAALVFGFMTMSPPDAQLETLLFGGNIIFLSTLAGWFLGELFRPSWMS